MAPPLKVQKAFRAMKNLGISEDIVKPVLKSLLKLYDKKWELIEEENYRALADAIFEYEEAKDAEGKKRPKSIDQEDDLEDEAQVYDEPELPLKRQRLRNNDGQSSSSLCHTSPCSSGMPLKKLIPEDAEPPKSSLHQSMDMIGSPNFNVSNIVPQNSFTAPENSGPSQHSVAMRSESDLVSSRSHLRGKGKEPILPQNAFNEMRMMSERPYRALQIKEQNPPPHIVPLPKNTVPDNCGLMKPKVEPVSDNLPQIELPIAVIHPEPLSKDASLGTASCERADGPEFQASECNDGYGKQKRVHGQGSSSGNVSSSEHSDIAEGSPASFDIASSSMGEVKISISCHSALGRPDFNIPNIDAVVKAVEDRYLGSYKAMDPSLSLRKLMNDVCECFLQLGTDSLDETQERSLRVAPLAESWEQSPALDALNVRFSIPSCSSNGLVNIQSIVVAAALPLHATDDQRQLDEQNNPEGTEHESSCGAIVAQQPQFTPHDIRLLHDVHDITRGEEKVKVPWTNNINNEHPPPFHYIHQNHIFKNVHVNFSLASIGDDACCSICFGNCLSSSVPCTCTHEFEGEYAYTIDGLLREEFLEVYKRHEATKIIRECWSKCGCYKQCGNRIVQRGLSYNLQVFLTAEGKGWGLRTLEDLRKGAFVCEYVGEMLTHAELRERKPTKSSEKHAYTVLLDGDRGSGGLKSKDAIWLDARYYGNVARFINHRCFDSNLVEIPVQVETADQNYYHLAFFTTRKVNALEELTWDYGLDFDDESHSIEAFSCKCGSSSCRDRKAAA